MLRPILALAFVLFVPCVSFAQPAEPLFVVGNAATVTRDQQAVGMRLDRLFAVASDRVALNIGDREWVAAFERIDTDVLGHRVWVGRIEGVEYSHVSIAERDGIVSGVINAVSEVYEIRTIGPGAYKVSGPLAAANDRELEPLIDASSGAADSSASPAPQIAADDARTIDVLLLYTPRAVARVGGIAQIQALIAQIISDTNTIFARSGITPRVRLAGSQQFDLTESTSMSGDLTAVTNSPVARGLRDQFRADLVQLLEDTNQSGVCGIAWLLTSLSSTNFNGYSVADVDCASQYTPTHEMGHNLGSHHAPEDDASFALFPYSFGYKDPARGFRTVMAYGCPNSSCPRVPNMSNPSIIHNGGATGSSAQNNALSVNNAAQTVANFRQRATGTPPGVPTGLRATVTANAVTLAWNAVTADTAAAADAASSYTLQVGTASGAANLFSQNVGNTTSVSGTVPSGTYFWRVTAVNASGQSAPSSEATFTVGSCVVPSAPQNFTISTGGGRVVTLLWNTPAVGTGPFTYLLEAGSATGLANLFNGGVGGLTTLSVQSPPGTYFVRARAQNACGVSAASTERVIVVP